MKGAWEVVAKKTVGYTENTGVKCLEDLQWVDKLHIASPLSLEYCGREQCRPEQTFGPYVRENYVLHMVLHGKGRLYAHGKVYPVFANQVFAIYPGEEVTYQADDEDPWEYMWVGFHGYASEKIVHFIGFSRENLLVSIENMDAVSCEIEKIFAARHLTVLDEMKRASSLYAVAALLIEGNRHRSEEDPLDDSDGVYVKMAVDIIMHSYADKLKISEIANSIGISRGYLTSLFKQEMNMSPQNFLINFRMEKAAQLLRDTNEPIHSIGISVGYVDSLSFSKAFKQKYNMSPSAYREAQAELLEVRAGYLSQYPL